MLDLLLGAARAVTEHHVLGEVRELLFTRRIAIGAVRHRDAHGHIVRTGGALEPDLEAVRKNPCLEARKRTRCRVALLREERRGRKRDGGAEAQRSRAKRSKEETAGRRSDHARGQQYERRVRAATLHLASSLS
jgi:hypothetical protein